MLLIPSSILSILDVSIILGVFSLMHVWLFRAGKPKQQLPPGPKPLPFIGNLLDMPSTHQWRTFAEWGTRWGDIVSVSVFGQHIVILNSLNVAIDLLDKRSAIYSDRPVLPMAGELMGWAQILGLSPYGERFRDIRRLLHKYIGTRTYLQNVARCNELKENETRRFLRHVMRDSSDLVSHIRRSVGAVILKLGYGYEVRDGMDPFVELVDRAMDGFAAATTPGSFLVDSIPILQYMPSWMPGSDWLRKARQWRHEFETICDVPYAMAKKAATDGSGVDNFVSYNIKHASTEKGDHHLKMAAASLYAGGADTTVSAIHTFFLAMTLYPEVQKRAQEEIDRVIGSDRLPSLEDRDHLPFVNALCCEVLRWQPIGPLGLPHRTLQDDYYNGHFIPKGSVVIANIWNMLHDPNMYSHPEDFRPERYLSGLDGNAVECDPRRSVFGFGRRICPGSELAESSLFITCAMSLASLNISKTIDDTGVELTPVIEYTTGAISHPVPFKCSIKPRSSQAVALVQLSAASQ